MHYVSGTIRPEGGSFNATERAIADEPSISREAVHNLSLVSENVAAVLTAHRGDADVLREVLAADPDVVDFTVTADGEDVYEYTHFEPNDLVLEVFGPISRRGVFVDYPLNYTDRGGLRGTVVGDEAELRRLMELVPEDVTTDVHGVGEYRPEAEQLREALTARQREVARAALALGYYRDPRAATSEDVADHLEISTTTVSEHLRKIHATLVRSVLGE